ncbi:MAG TPA: crossover junction endodeoxyribonuclease RuvC [Candidatus Paceibacterota bacterium]|nr:crossover junction endodeoxyribonuclease RuvC [Candidatus Paceibacterota bacterium]
MKVLGIDPGYGRCGMAVVERQDGKDVLLYSGCVETAASDEFPFRLSAIVAACEELIAEHAPAALSIEKLYFNANQKTAMRVAEARGAIISCAAGRGVDVFEYTPAQVKSAVASSGTADKKQVATMLHLLVKIDKDIRRDDEYDAIAIALAHLAMARNAAVV